MQSDRRRVIRGLLKSESGRMTTAAVAGSLNKSLPTARETMKALGALGAVAVKVEIGLTISLLDSEQWLRSDAQKWVLERVL